MPRPTPMYALIREQYEAKRNAGLSRKDAVTQLVIELRKSRDTINVSLRRAYAKERQTETHTVEVETLTSGDFEIPQANILFFDIETSPNLSYTWGKYEQNVLSFEREWYIMAFSAKWLGGDTISRCLPDFDSYETNPHDDLGLVKEIWELFEKADIVVAHNGDRFDIPKCNARFLAYGMPRPSFYQTVDTRKEARRHFKLNSNKLDDIGNFLGVGRKVDNGGFKLWMDCLQGNREAWELMRTYNTQDVHLLEAVYLKLRPWIRNHPNVGLIQRIEDACPSCGSLNLIEHGHRMTRTGISPAYQCGDCKSWAYGRHKKITEVR